MNERPTEPMSKYGTITANRESPHMITWPLLASRLTSVLTAGRPVAHSTVYSAQRLSTNFYLEKITDNEFHILKDILHVLLLK